MLCSRRKLLEQSMPYPRILIVNISIYSLYRHTSFYYTSLYCISQIMWVLQLKVCGNPVLSKSFSGIFPITFAHFVSLSVFQLFHYISCGDLWPANFDVTIIIVLGHHKPHLYKMVSLTNKCVCSQSSISWSLRSLFSSLPIPRQQYWSQANQ